MKGTKSQTKVYDTYMNTQNVSNYSSLSIKIEKEIWFKSGFHISICFNLTYRQGKQQ